MLSEQRRFARNPLTRTRSETVKEANASVLFEFLERNQRYCVLSAYREVQVFLTENLREHSFGYTYADFALGAKIDYLGRKIDFCGHLTHAMDRQTRDPRYVGVVPL